MTELTQSIRELLRYNPELEEAVAARKAAERQFGFHANQGSTN